MVMPPAFSSSRVFAAGETSVAGATEQILLLVGRSAVIHTDRSIQRVSLSTPEIADAMVTTPRELLVHGKAPGTISLLVWSDNGRITTYEVIVRRDLTPLEGQIRRQFPNEPIAVAVNGKDVVLSGVVSAKHVIDSAKLLAAGYVEKPENVVNMMRQTESVETNQVMLKVRFAEVNRSAMQELGVNFFGGPTGDKGWMGRSTTGQFPAPRYDVGQESVDHIRLSQCLRFHDGRCHRRHREGTQGPGTFREPRGTEPGDAGRQRSELPGGRRVSVPGGPGRRRQPVGDDRIQGIRHPPAVYAHPHRWRLRPSEGGARSERARLRQCGHARGIQGARRSRPAAPRPTSSCTTARRLRFPDCSIETWTRRFGACPVSATSRFLATCSAARRTRSKTPSSSS
jgi:hypothetical protein